MKKRGILHNAQQAYEVWIRWWPEIKAHLLAGHKLHIEIKPETRSLEANARMWAMLTDISEQVVWHGRKLTPEEWKHVFTASLARQDVVPGLDGGFVVLGKSTSQMSRREMSDLQELMSAFGSARCVEWSEPVRIEEPA
jgi:hypothetical protein